MTTNRNNNSSSSRPLPPMRRGLPFSSAAATLLLLAALFLPFLAAPAAAIGDDDMAAARRYLAEHHRQQRGSEGGSGGNSNGRVIHLPLVPHHAHVARRERELREAGIDVDGGGGRQLADDARTTTTTATRDAKDSGAFDLQVASLFQGYGTHYADLWCGTPPQRQTVIVDTGSGVTAFPCAGCNDCGVPNYHVNPLFDSTTSSTYEELPCGECSRGGCNGANKCHIGMSYQEGSSWSAIEVRDRCYVGGMHDVAVSVEDEGEDHDDLNPFNAAAFAFPLKFGCQDRVTGLFKTQLADGIMGMDNAKTSFWSQMCAEHDMKRQFSLCFSRSPIASKQGTNAGAMTLGGYDDRFHKYPMLYADIDRSGSGFYGVTVRNMYLKEQEDLPDDAVNLVSVFAGTPRLLKGITAIVDSGTTDSYFERAIQGGFEKAWTEMVGANYGHGSVKLTDEQLKSLPTIVFQVAGNEALNRGVSELNGGEAVPGMVGPELDPDHPYDILVHMPPHHYMEYNAKGDTYSARFYTDESGGGSVMGANLMMGHNVFFDVDKRLVGWAMSDCDYEGLVKPFVEKGAVVPNANSNEEVQKKKQAVPNDAVPPTDHSVDQKPTPSTPPPQPKPQPQPKEDESPADAETTDESKGALEEAHGSGTGMLGMCDTASCKFTAFVIAGSVLAVLIIGAIMLHRRRAGGRYRVTAASELELQAGAGGAPGILSASSNDGSDDGFDNVRYRDHVSPANSGEGGDEKASGGTIVRTSSSDDGGGGSDDGVGGGAYLVDPDDDDEELRPTSRGVLS